MTAARPPLTPETLYKSFRRRRWQMLLPAIAITAAATWWIHRLPNRYRSDAVLLFVPQRVQETFVRSSVATRNDNRLQSLTPQILSRTQLEPIIRDFDLYADRRSTSAMQDIVDAMRLRDIEIQPVKGDAFRLGFIAESPETAMKVAERLAALFIGQTSLDRESMADGTDRFLATQLEDARGKLVEIESTLDAYRRRHNGELPKQLDANVQGLRNTETRIHSLDEALRRDRDRQLVLERSLKEAQSADLADAVASARPRVPVGEPSKPGAAEQLARMEGQLKEMQSTFTAQHPDVVAMAQTVGELRQRVEAERARQVEAGPIVARDPLRQSRAEDVRNELSMVTQQIGQNAAEIERLRGVLVGYQRRVDAEPMREAELATLTRDYDTLQDTYRVLLSKKQESEIAANLERQQIGAQFKILDPARLPERPFAPNRSRLYPMGVLAGLAIGVALAVVLEWLDRGLRTEHDVRAVLGLPVLATIPLASRPASTGRRVATALSLGTAVFAGAAALAWQLLK